MGLFGSLFGGGSESEKTKSALPWVPLDHVDQLANIISKSHQLPQVIFKHSTSCGISRMVLNMFGDTYGLEASDADLYYLDLHAHRDVSNEVAASFQVMHQSPQLLIVKNGVVTFHTSHGAITEVDLKSLV